MTSARTAAKPNELDYYLRKPLLRKLMCRLLHLFGNGIDFIGNIFDNSMIKEYGYNFKTGLVVMPMFLKDSYGTVIEVDKNGKIITSLQAPDSTISLISEAREVRVNDKETILYLGSFANNFIGKLNLKR